VSNKECFDLEIYYSEISFIVSRLELNEMFSLDSIILEVRASDFETHAPGSTLTEALRFRQERHPELKCYSALIKSSSKI